LAKLKIRETIQDTLVHLLKSLFGGLPIDHIPDSTEILSFPVLILKAVDPISYAVLHHGRKVKS